MPRTDPLSKAVRTALALLLIWSATALCSAHGFEGQRKTLAKYVGEFSHSCCRYGEDWSLGAPAHQKDRTSTCQSMRTGALRLGAKDCPASGIGDQSPFLAGFPLLSTGCAWSPETIQRLLEPRNSIPRDAERSHLGRGPPFEVCLVPAA